MTDQDNLNADSKVGVKSVALIAHDNKKAELINWVELHRSRFEYCQLYATGTTGKLLTERTGLSVTCFHSGPLGGDQQIGACIAEGKIDLLIFFWDPLEPMSHDPDIKALLRLATLWNTPSACNEATADFLISSPCFADFKPDRPDFSGYLTRSLDAQ